MSIAQPDTEHRLDGDTRRTVHTAISELQRLSDLFCQRREQLARSVGLTVQQWHVLEEISDEHFMPSMFARRRESSAAAVSKIIRQLLDKDLVDVQVDANDGRLRRYRLTPAGVDLMLQLRANRQEAIDAIWGGIPPDRLFQFQQFAADLSDRLEQFSEQQNNQRETLEGIK